MRLAIDMVESELQQFKSANLKLFNQIKDYIKTLKNNNYQSLHMILVGSFYKKIEIQIRTAEMYNVAGYGSAAHSLCKLEKKGDKRCKEPKK